MQRMSSISHTNFHHATSKLVPVRTQPNSSQSTPPSTSPLKRHAPSPSQYGPDDLSMIRGESRRLERGRTTSEPGFVRHEHGPLGLYAEQANESRFPSLHEENEQSSHQRSIPISMIPGSPPRRGFFGQDRLASSLPNRHMGESKTDDSLHNVRMRYYHLLNIKRSSSIGQDQEEESRPNFLSPSLPKGGLNPMLNGDEVPPTRSRGRSQSDSTGLRSMEALESLKRKPRSTNRSIQTSQPRAIPNRKGKFDIDFKPSLSSSEKRQCILDEPTFEEDGDQPFEMEME